ncbi:uncharacterized protein TNIN_96821 [Trichonephila inaurata madagascariensis]|uniref:Uncharacterized protein n=1 Tax=Trichonephila inaurata madagascariensis TaxID=2747483 RepID=A0A8X6YA48_9ARAC|nr:uncharacterized protein TNIN_96821 [Trichonephila inaurata madagascariensis]
MKLLDLGEDLRVAYLIGALPSDVTSLIAVSLKGLNRTWKDYYFEIRVYFEAFEHIQRSLPSGPRRNMKTSKTINDGRQVSSRKPERLPKREYSHAVPNERSPLKCYGCGRQGVIKSRSLTATPAPHRCSSQSHQCLHSSD